MCIRDRFKAAQADGWEKQYPYKVGRKKVYMPPSEAEKQGLELSLIHIWRTASWMSCDKDWRKFTRRNWKMDMTPQTWPEWYDGCLLYTSRCV